ncbi:hypothetical protein [Ligilactobacillus faecis]|uniref:hypothetical protein n=1 Tax=Ligilactobacillus faecis TaxID=762833 RepID=UPI00246933D1|nr:hypothetical protein [Ligilactobacillus faecis]WGN89004.1 hypothetical protein QFX10_08090 [Ligilactobacillus faecis]
MNSRINELLEKYNAVLEISDEIENDGFCIETPDINVIIVRSGLDNNYIEQVILHELGHVANDNDIIGKYKDYIPRSQMEYKANFYMIEHTLDTWCNTNDIDLKDVNCTTFLSANNLSLNYIPIVETIIKNKVGVLLG